MDRLTKSFSVFDCDAHINDPLQIWDYVPESKKELVHNTYWRSDDAGLLNGSQPVMAGGNAQFPGYNPICIAGPQMNKKIMRKLNTMELTPEQKAYVHHDGAIDPHARLIEMDLMGIDQVLVIPTMMIMHLPFATDPAGVGAFCEAYNNFLKDWCGEVPDRLFGAAMLPVQDPDLAAAEIRRSAELGHPVGLIRPIDANALYPQRRRSFVAEWRRALRRRLQGIRGHRDGARHAHLPGAQLPAPAGQRVPGVAGRAVHPVGHRLPDLLVHPTRCRSGSPRCS